MPLVTQASITWKRRLSDVPEAEREHHLHGPLQLWGKSDQGDILKSISVNFVETSNSVRWTRNVLLRVSSLLLRGNKRTFYVNAEHSGTVHSSGSTRKMGEDRAIDRGWGSDNCGAVGSHPVGEDALSDLPQHVLSAFFVRHVTAEIHTKSSVDLDIDESRCNNAPLAVDDAIWHDPFLGDSWKKLTEVTWKKRGVGLTMTPSLTQRSSFTRA